MKKKVSIWAAREILLSRPEKYIFNKWTQLVCKCRAIKCIDIWGYKFIAICGEKNGHKDRHEDINGGVYWE